MIDKTENLSFITDENGKDTPIRVICEFNSEDNQRRFVVYTTIEDKENEDDQDYFVAEIVQVNDGEELRDIENEDDLAYCQNVFDEMMEEDLFSESVEEDKEEEEETPLV